MKRILLILLTLFLSASALFAGGKKDAAADNGKPNVTAVNFPAYDFVRQIAGDRVNLSMLLPPGAESHSFEPSPRDIITIQRSNVFIYIGGETDIWVGRILNSMDTSKMRIIRMMDAVDVVEEEIVEGMEHDHDDEEGIAYDEHVWTSPLNAVRIVRSISAVLCDIDAANAAIFQQNARSYTAALEELDRRFHAVVDGAKRKTVVFGDRFPFRYFADAYGLSYFAAFPGCSAETEPSAATVTFLINKIRSEKIPVVFYIELSNERMADTLSWETGAKKLLLHACHNITKRDFDSGLGYLVFMRRNVDNLREALY